VRRFRLEEIRLQTGIGISDARLPVDLVDAGRPAQDLVTL